ncbi:MAG TPA: reverse transcriptase-like protein [Anaerolineae bacterium]|nr:reverse transcriptase-like protein [Anaerolineae bacterium]
MQDERLERILEAVRALPEEKRQRLLRRLMEEYGLPAQESLPLAFTAAQLEGPADYELLFDGGSQGNPGPAYGSYRLTRTADRRSDLVRLDFQQEMTNNEAEYQTLIAALEGLIGRIEAAGRDPGGFTVEVRGDSALVFHQVEGTWKAKDDRMRALRNRMRELLARFKAYRLMLQGREESVRALGH